LPRVGFWLLAPAAAVQGLWLRPRAQRLPGAPGARSGAAGNGESLRLLAVGDSIIDGVGTPAMQQALPAQFAAAVATACGRRVEWRAEGLAGRDIRGTIVAVRELQDAKGFDLVLISVGVNDVTALSRSRRWRRDVAALLAAIHGRWPGAQILFAGLPPMQHFPLLPQPLRLALGLRAGRLDRIAAQIVAGHPRALHVPTRIGPQHGFCSDGFHPSAESCTLWSRELAAALARSSP
jgi:lysophospholipase L1-like esterase